MNQKSIWERLRQESETKELASLSTNLEQDPILKKLWNNEKDSAYDKVNKSWSEPSHFFFFKYQSRDRIHKGEVLISLHLSLFLFYILARLQLHLL